MVVDRKPCRDRRVPIRRAPPFASYKSGKANLQTDQAVGNVTTLSRDVRRASSAEVTLGTMTSLVLTTLLSQLLFVHGSEISLAHLAPFQ